MKLGGRSFAMSKLADTNVVMHRSAYKLRNDVDGDMGSD
jgi:hypothetical protein